MNMKKIFALLLAVCMILAMAACGKETTKEDGNKAPGATEPAGNTQTADLSDAIGSFALIGDEQLIVFYDVDGKVVGITDRADAPVHEDQVGKAAADAIRAILEDAVLVSNYLLMIQRPESLAPNADFFTNLKEVATAAISNRTVILSTAADQNEMGYISAETAKAIVAAYLNHPENTTYTSTATAMDGYYQVSAVGTIGGDFNVGALYGAVEEFIVEGDDEVIGDDYIDFDDLTANPGEEVVDQTEEPAEEPAEQF